MLIASRQRAHDVAKVAALKGSGNVVFFHGKGSTVALSAVLVSANLSLRACDLLISSPGQKWLGFRFRRWL